MKEVVVYSSGFCPYCFAAKRLLAARGVVYEEIDVDFEPGRRAEMVARTGRRTVPQIFIGSHHVGGCDELHALERAGGLDALLEDAGR